MGWFDNLFNWVNNIPGGAIWKQYFGTGATDHERMVHNESLYRDRRDYHTAHKWRAEDIERDERRRSEDIARDERWRAEDIERNSLQYRMKEAKEAGLHTATAAMGGSGGGGSIGRAPTTTSSGGRIQPPSGGNVPRGGAGASMNPMDQASLFSQLQLDRGQLQVMQAEARKINAEADNLSYRTTDRIDAEIFNIIASASHSKAQTNQSVYQSEYIQQQTQQVKLAIKEIMHNHKVDNVGTEENPKYRTDSDSRDKIMADLMRAGTREGWAWMWTERGITILEDILKVFLF